MTTLLSQNDTEAKIEKQINRATLQVQPTSPFYDHFAIEGNTIKYNVPFNTYYNQFLLSESIPERCVYYFKWKIAKSLKNGIFIGITDWKYINEKVSHQLPNSYSFFGKKALNWPGRIQQNKGFTQGDIVMVKIDRKEGFISWEINGNQIARKNSSKLKESQIKYVPFIQMADQGDTLIWLGSWKQE